MEIKNSISSAIIELNNSIEIGSEEDKKIYENRIRKLEEREKRVLEFFRGK